MRNFVSVILNNPSSAFDAQNALRRLDADGDITVHGTAVVHRDKLGQLIVDTEQSTPTGLATAIGVGLGALVGALAGPAGLAGAAIVGAGTGAAVGT